MNRIDRLNALMIYLQSRSRVTMDQLEEKFELTRRTLFRDIRALIDGGLPIGGDAGSGYFIVEGYHLPPVIFSKEEASALLLGSKFVQNQADRETSTNYNEALTKVKAVLRFADKEHLDQLEEKITVIPAHSTAAQGFPDSHLKTIQSALTAQKTLEFDYFSNYNNTITHREVEPLGLVFYSNRWHLMAHCLMRDDLRDFRTDRIQKVEITRNEFNPDARKGYAEFLKRSLMGTDALEAIIEVQKKVARFLSDQKYNYGFMSEEHNGDWVRMTFSTPSYNYFCRWLLSYTDSIRLIAPDSLNQTMSRLVDDLVKTHTPGSINYLSK
jgi:predicted DNA-binding transcriptional regulator YafY